MSSIISLSPQIPTPSSSFYPPCPTFLPCMPGHALFSTFTSLYISFLTSLSYFYSVTLMASITYCPSHWPCHCQPYPQCLSCKPLLYLFTLSFLSSLFFFFDMSYLSHLSFLLASFISVLKVFTNPPILLIIPVFLIGPLNPAIHGISVASVNNFFVLYMF